VSSQVSSPSQRTNRLARETSPYLLQHQHNPVDWFPWGAEAFETARAQNKPIFLSVGYSTCYWCHVMERQCFENEAIAREMNERFVNIKVDREERPDVDQLYMNAVQVLTRHGGWPMSVFLTPDLRPFYGGTYFPPEDMHGRPGFPTVLRGIDDAYRNRRDDVLKSADQLVDILEQLAEPMPADGPVTIDEIFVEQLVQRSVSDYEPTHGGFGMAPKFPRETLLQMLLLHNHHNPDERREKMLRHTLDAMASGGIRDHLGGAFHRYSTDAKWLVPHFEIMLYDNAMLAWCYVEAYRQFEQARYATVARGILDFTLREMTSPLGPFYTAFDAEVDAEEGKTYLWTLDEVEQTLRLHRFDPIEIKRFTGAFGLDEGPNFADPHHGSGVADRNVLYLADPSLEDDGRIVSMRRALYESRRQRKQPLLDTKILTGWNGLMIRAMASAGHVLQEPRYLEAAGRAAEFLLRHHRMRDGGLYRTSRPDASTSGTNEFAAKYNGFLDDYAFLAQGVLALHRADGGEKWKDAASSVVNAMKLKFADAPSTGSEGLYFTDADATDLIIRQKTGLDSPLPSGNAVAGLVCLELNDEQTPRAVLETFAGTLQQNAEGMSAMVELADAFVRRYGSLRVEARPRTAADRPLSPQQLAAGIVSLDAAWEDARTLHVHLTILKGFHINANAAAKDLIATRLDLRDADSATIEYPPGAEQRFAFSDGPLRVYEGKTTIIVRFSKPQSGRDPVEMRLTYQACDESACLPPVTKQFSVATP
jgi:uncharacterized protein YyaL (SSP411 family)